MNSRLRVFLYIAAAVIITAAVSIATTVMVMNRRQTDHIVLDSAQFQAYNQLSPLIEMMDIIEKEHYGKEVTREELTRAALDAVLAATQDPYARYYTQEEYAAFLTQMGGTYHGIGALVGQPAQTGAPVLRVYKDSPAAKVGLLVGDIIVAVDGTKLSNLALEELERLFGGEDGSQVQLDVLRGTQNMPMSITRGAGVTQRVEHKLFQQYTGYIRIDKFAGTTVEEFKEALQDLTDRGMRCLVVDLRNNPGGELEQVVAVADMLLPECHVVSVHEKNGQKRDYESDAKYTDVPLAVLVNENSASASELLAAAIQENERGLIVGAKTFGKGVVQTTMQLKSNEAWVKLTTAAYYTPKGNSVDHTGVTPDIEIDLADDVKSLPIEEIPQDVDAQLWAALDEIREQADALDAA